MKAFSARCRAGQLTFTARYAAGHDSGTAHRRAVASTRADGLLPLLLALLLLAGVLAR